MPSWTARCRPGRPPDLIADRAVRLSDRGGAGLPRRPQDARRGTAPEPKRLPGAVVVANGSESEPASRKDGVLLSHAPHLVLDGVELAPARRCHPPYLCVSPQARARRGR